MTQRRWLVCAQLAPQQAQMAKAPSALPSAVQARNETVQHLTWHLNIASLASTSILESSQYTKYTASKPNRTQAAGSWCVVVLQTFRWALQRQSRRLPEGARCSRAAATPTAAMSTLLRQAAHWTPLVQPSGSQTTAPQSCRQGLPNIIYPGRLVGFVALKGEGLDLRLKP